MNKYLYNFVLACLLVFPLISQGQNYLFQSFEGKSEEPDNSAWIPAGWKDIAFGEATGRWKYVTEGTYGEPAAAYDGTYLAKYEFLATDAFDNKLISPEIDLSKANKPQLDFALAMIDFSESVDQLTIQYRQHPDSTWLDLKQYKNALNNWTKQTLILPDTLLSDRAQIAFYASAQQGAGIYIDSISVYETEKVPFSVNDISVIQSNISFAPFGANKVPIALVEIDVAGNNGTLQLETLKITSNNTDDDVILEEGLQVYTTEDSIFQLPEKTGYSTSFTNGMASIENIDQNLSFGKNYFWITYDLKASLDYTHHGALLDIKIPADGITINGTDYLLTEQNPEGNTKLEEAIFFDNFDNGNTGWNLGNEFEIGEPNGLGNTGPSLYPDPDSAYSSPHVLGSDLSMDGNYLENDSVISPLIETNYYKNTKIYFNKWLNTHIAHDAFISVSDDNGQTWTKLWQDGESSFYWKTFTRDIALFFSKYDTIQVQFYLDNKNAPNEASGWNIDNFAITGDFIDSDVGVTAWLSPQGGCNLGQNADITLEITNFGGAPVPAGTPVEILLEEGAEVLTATLNETIPIGEARNVTISGANLSTPKVYENVVAKTTLASDEMSTNNALNYTLYVDSLYTLPYQTSFENITFWRQEGVNSTWETAEPLDIAPYHGSKTWVTDPLSSYKSNDSSWVESPCFTYPQGSTLMLDFALWTRVIDENDGFTVLYSNDNGISWKHLPTSPVYNKNWYNSTEINSMGLPGWTGSTGDWQNSRNIIPEDAGTNGSFKLRFLFKSDDIETSEGVAIDMLKIYEAPYDVAVTQLLSPGSACELSNAESIEVAIENLGIHPIPAGTKIPVGLDFNGTYVQTDTLTLTADLAVNTTVPFIFDTTLNMFNAGDYEITAYTKLEDDPYYYSETANDTLTQTVSVTGIPGYDIGDILGVEAPVDVTLDAGSGYTSYNWSTGDDTQTLQVNAVGEYSVTVTNANGCEAADTVTVVDSREEVALSQVITSVSDACTHDTPVYFEVEITNNGLDPYSSGDVIPVALQVNNETPIEENLTLSAALDNTAPGNTVNYTFSSPVDISTPGDYIIKLYTNINKDLDKSNDTITINVNTWGFPDVELAHDTLYSSQADTIVLDAGADFATYTWSNSATTQTTSPADNTSSWYTVTVTDIHGCGEDADSTYINTTDIGIGALITPTSACTHNTEEDLRIQLTNYSDDDMPSGTVIPFSYTLNEGSVQQTQVTLGSAIPGGGGTLETTLDNKLDLAIAGAYNLQLWHTYTPDANASQDTLSAIFETYGLPDVELPFDTIYTTRPDTVTLDAGTFANYTWQDGYTGQVYSPMKDSTYLYKVTVDNGHGCTPDSDSTLIIAYDLALTDIKEPRNGCVLSSQEPVRFRIKNRGQDVLPKYTNISAQLEVDGTLMLDEQYALQSSLLPGESKEFILSGTLDLQTPGAYKLKAYIGLQEDAKRSNDTLTLYVQHFGNPTVTLSQKKYYTTMADTLEVAAPSGFTWYQWESNTGDVYENDTLSGLQNISKQYKLTVADANGCYAEDSIEVFTHDLGAIALTAPLESCSYSNTEPLSITVKNYGLDTYPPGEEIPVAYRVDAGTWVEEIITLTSELPHNGELDYTFTQTTDLSANKTFTIDIETRYADEAGLSNDRIQTTLDALAPNFDLGEPVTTEESSYTLDAGSGYSAYLWFDGSTEQTYTVEMNDQSTNQYYSVTVENAEGCSTTDSVQVLFNFEADLGVSQVRTPASGCLTEEDVFMDITFMNLGTSTIPSGTQITVGYEHENMTPITETVTLSSELASNGTIDYQFTNPVVLSNNSSYLFKVYTAYTNDNNASNDTLTKGVDIEDPLVDLGPDTLTVEEFPYFLDAGDFETYVWNTGDTKQTIEAPGPGDYSVTVTDAQGCIAIDSIYLKEEDPDTGWEDLQKSSSIDIYPNPVNNLLYLEFNERETSDYTIVLLNMAGEQVYFKNLKRMSEDAYQINVSNYAQGIYYLLIRWDDKFYTEKIIIE